MSPDPLYSLVKPWDIGESPSPWELHIRIKSRLNLSHTDLALMSNMIENAPLTIWACPPETNMGVAITIWKNTQRRLYYENRNRLGCPFGNPLGKNLKSRFRQD